MSETPQNPGDKRPSLDLPRVPLDTEPIKEVIGDVRQRAETVYSDAPPQVKEVVVRSQSFYQEHKRVIHGVVVGVVALKLYKRRVARASAKAVVEQLAKDPSVNLPTMIDILQDLRNNPMMAYIPHGGGMVHMLGGKDVIVTVFGAFEKMTTDQVWAEAAKKLGMLSNSPQVVGR